MHMEMQIQSTIKYVAANQDGSVVAYRWNGENKGVQIRVATRSANGTYELLGSISKNGSANCFWPAISATGRYVAFSGGGKAYRYDRTTATLDCVSADDESAGALAISRNGRYVAYVAGDDQNATVTKHDCGIALTTTSAQLSFDRLGVVVAKALPLEIVGTVSDSATLRFDSDTLESGDSIYYYDAAGTDHALEAGTAYALNAAPLPWYFKPATGTDSALCTITITLTDGEITSSVDVKIALRGQFVNLTAGMAGTNSYSDMDFNADGTMVVVRSDGILAPNDANSAFDLYAVNGISTTTKFQQLSNGGSGSAQLYGGKISGNGNYVFCFRQDGTLCRYDIVTGESTELLAGADRYRTIAVSYDGTVVAVVKNSEVQLSTDSGKTFSVVSSIDADNAPFVSYDGSAVSFVSSGKLMRYHVNRNESETVLSDVAQLLDVSQGGTRFLLRTSANALQYYVLAENKADTLGIESKDCTTPDGTSLPTKYTAKLSANGRSVFLLCATGLYTRQYKSDTWQLTLNSGAIKSTGDFAVASSGRYLLFSSSLSSLDPTAQSAEGENNLLLWRNPQWSNSAARIDVTNYDVTEDTQITINNSHFCADSDDDDVVPIVVSGPSHGTLTLEEPTNSRGKYRFVYQPNENFCGADTFELKLWDGSDFTETKTISLNVKNVNDEPQWIEDECTTSLTVNAGENVSAQVRASDVDTENPEEYRDTLTYSIIGDAPEWLTIDSSTGTITLELSLTAVAGEYNVTLGCTDGHIDVPIERQLVITVNAPAAQEFTLAYLFGKTSAKPSDDTDSSALATWRAALFGCWAHLLTASSNEYQLLSLPGDVSASALSVLFSGNRLYLWHDNSFRIADATDTIPAGTGFWIKPALAENAEECTIAITPVMSRRDASFADDAFYLLGPLVDEDAPASMQQFYFDGKTWHQTTTGWKLGTGYFFNGNGG